MSENASRRADTGSHDTELYASAIMAIRGKEVMVNVFLSRAVHMSSARILALGEATARWPRSDGFYDYQEATMKISQHLSLNDIPTTESGENNE